jgi:hypothetical protein
MTKTAMFKTHLTGKVGKKLDKRGPRLQLEKCYANHTAMLEHKDQMDKLLDNIFPENDIHKRKPKNWLSKMQNLVGGNTYQHPHSDQGRPMEYKEETTFPFVATHGFGIYPFELWLLPQASGQHKHGFLHRFKPHALILMRGDFVHAGGASIDPRCHMMFYPKPEAGLVFNHEYHYWLDPNFRCSIDAIPKDEIDDLIHIDASFLWQHNSFPFAYPVVSYVPNSMGSMRTVLTYPPNITADLVSLRKTPEREITWRTVTGQRF